MRIIGEKINGTRKKVAAAIADRDAGYVTHLATSQAEAGAAWLDLNAGTRPDREPDDLVWLVDTVQAVTDTPLVLDSANPAALRSALERVERTPVINSISGERNRIEGILPLAAEYGTGIVALAISETGIPETATARMDVVRDLISHTRAAGIKDEDVYVDPLVLTVATNNDSAVISLETMRMVRAGFPDVHMTVGLSNVSFGLPARAQINRGFLTLAIAAGLDTAIADPLDKGLQTQILVAEMLLGRDRHCLNYVRASRNGLFPE
jgi:5-methyltetrahydrofolate--homocysteine methyltransferase